MPVSRIFDLTADASWYTPGADVGGYEAVEVHNKAMTTCRPAVFQMSSKFTPAKNDVHTEYIAVRN